MMGVTDELVALDTGAAGRRGGSIGGVERFIMNPASYGLGCEHLPSAVFLRLLLPPPTCPDMKIRPGFMFVSFATATTLLACSNGEASSSNPNHGTGAQGPGGAGNQGGSGGDQNTGADLLWVRQYGDDNLQHATALTRSGDSDVVLTGRFHGDLTIGTTTLSSTPPLQQVFVTKLDADGQPVFTKSLLDTFSYDVAVDSSENILISMQTTGPVDLGGGDLPDFTGVTLLKLSPSGEHLFSQGWQGLVPLAEGWASFVAADPDDNILLAGQHSSETDFGDGTHDAVDGFDIYIAKFTPLGLIDWRKSFGGLDDQFVGDIASDPDGSIILAGDFLGTLGFGAAPLSAGAYPSLWVAKLDASGAEVFSVAFDGWVDPVMSVATDGDDNIIVAGTFSIPPDFGGGPIDYAGGSDVFVAKLDGEGQVLFARGFGGATDDVLGAVSVDDEGNILLTGTFDGEADYGDGPHAANELDQFVIKLDPVGTTRWSRSYGLDGDQTGDGIAADDLGNVVFVTSGDGLVDFGGGVLSSAGSLDLFLAKRAP